MPGSASLRTTTCDATWGAGGDGGRPRPVIGAYGTISFRRRGSSYVAMARYRDADGRLRRVTGAARSESVAKARLRERRVDRRSRNRRGSGCHGVALGEKALHADVATRLLAKSVLPGGCVEGIDNAAIAGSYSALAAVLAGFALSCLTLIASRTNPSAVSMPSGATRSAGRDNEHENTTATSHSSSGALALLVAATVALTGASLAYALMSGEPASSNLLGVEHVLAGSCFTAGALSFLLALDAIVVEVSPELERWLRKVVGLGAPTVTLVFLGNGTYDANRGVDEPFVLPVILAGFVVQFAAVVAAAIRKGSALTVQIHRHIATVAIWVSLVAVLSVALFNSLDLEQPSPAWAACVWFAIATLALGTFTVVVGSSGRR